MPNYCECHLIVSGPSEDLKRFVVFVRDDKRAFSFDKIIPYPEPFRSLDKAQADWFAAPPRGSVTETEPPGGFGAGGREWREQNWGTKWDARDSVQFWYGRSAEYRFCTAYDPPKPVIVWAAALWPTLSFELNYYDRGQQIRGTLSIDAKDEYRPEVVIKEVETDDYCGMLGG